MWLFIHLEVMGWATSYIMRIKAISSVWEEKARSNLGQRYSLVVISTLYFYVSVKYLFKFLFFYVPVTTEYKLYAYPNNITLLLDWTCDKFIWYLLSILVKIRLVWVWAMMNYQEYNIVKMESNNLYPFIKSTTVSDLVNICNDTIYATWRIVMTLFFGFVLFVV